MSSQPSGGQVYICPMHKDVREAGPGKCPKCGMALLPEGTRFAMFRHMFSNPLPLIVMGAIMVVLMIAAMMPR
jgi:hypothetical protein